MRAHPKGVSCDREGGVDARARRKDGGINHIEILEFVSPGVRIEHARPWIVAKPTSTAYVAERFRGIDRRKPCRAQSTKKRTKIGPKLLAPSSLAGARAIGETNSPRPVARFDLDAVGRIRQIFEDRCQYRRSL